MFCPNCGTEYREGFTVCADCNIPLVNELPRHMESELINPVTVYKTGDPAFITYAESFLQSQGINCYIRGAGLQELFAGGRLGTGYNVVAGPVEIQVDKRDVERAKDILSLIEKSKIEENAPESSESQPKKYEDKSTNKKQKVKDILKGIIVGALVVSSIAFYLYPEYKQKYSGVQKFDLNKDGKPDLFYTFENGVCVSSAQDRNFDGKIDMWAVYKNESVVGCKSDDNFDGRVDTWYHYRNGITSRIERDTNSDNKPEIIEDYTDGVLSGISWYHEPSHSLWKKASYVNGIMREEWVDQNYDGKFDLKKTYDSSERPIKTESLR